MRPRRLALSERLEFFLQIFFLATFAAAALLLFRGAEKELVQKREDIGKGLDDSLDLTNKGVDLLLNVQVIPAAIRAGDRAKADTVIKAFIGEGAELSSVEITTRDLRVFTRVGDGGLDDLLRGASAEGGQGRTFLFFPAGPKAAEAVVIRRPIFDGGRPVGSFWAQVDLSAVLRRIGAEHAFRFPVRVAGLGEQNGRPRAVVESSLGPGRIFAEVVDHRIGVALLLVLSTALLYLLCRLLIAKMLFPFELLVGKLDAVIKGERSPIDERKYPSLFLPFIGNINRLIASVIETQERQRTLMASLALQETASQVAHDIRSPLAALDVLLGDVSHMPEDKRIVVRGAVERIKDIANNLIEKTRVDGNGPPAREVPLERQLLTSLLEPLISEKRTQLRSRPEVELDGRFDRESYGLFAVADATELKRAISNLIDNAVESGAGKIRVRVLPQGDSSAAIAVSDDGRGIAPEILAKIGRKGATHGKPGGSGLGLHHARVKAEAWGGALRVTSEPGKGTTAEISLPRAEPPAWFVSRLELASGAAVAILDDDSSIHRIWEGRFQSLRFDECGVAVMHFSTSRELRAWAAAKPGEAAAALFLMDYELIGENETGLDVIRDLGLNQRSILVTSRFEERSILGQCSEMGVRLIPKSSAGLVPIDVSYPSESLDCVLIDDDDLVGLTWTSAARRSGKRVAAFSTPEAFFAKAAGMRRETPIYVDCRLRAGVRGEDVARKAAGLGFANVFLCTGDDPSSFGRLDFVKGVVGKTPPWISEPS